MHAGTCQVEGRVAGGGRAGGGALALWPGAPCGCGPTSCEREALIRALIMSCDCVMCVPHCTICTVHICVDSIVIRTEVIQIPGCVQLRCV